MEINESTQDQCMTTAEQVEGLLVKAVIPPAPPLPEVDTEPKEKLHKQPRGYLKTTASNVGRDKENMSLFSQQTYDDKLQPIRETITKNTSITGQYLIALWQKNKDDRGVYKITNLSEVARPLNVSPQELKNYLIYLGGYTYPVMTRQPLPNGKTQISISNSLLFSVRWNFIEDTKKYNNDQKVGTRLSYYLKEVPVQSVEIIPNQSFIDEIEGRGLGNILATEELIPLMLNLSDMAYKLFCLSGSNKTNVKIGFKNLVSKRYLNLERVLKGVYDSKGRQIKKGRGKPYTLVKIKEGLTELKERGQIERWSYDIKGDMFSWTCTNNIYKHKSKVYTLSDKRNLVNVTGKGKSK